MSTNDHRLLPPPYVKQVLPDIEGGEANLLPVSAAQADLEVWFPMFPIVNPGTAEEKLTLYWDGSLAAERSWHGAVAPDTLFVVVPQNLLRQGEHEIYYHFISYNAAEVDSSPYSITIDTMEPVLNTSNERLIFPAEIISNGVTAQYLQNHGNKVEAVIPNYAPIKPGDVLTWFWDRAAGSREEAGSYTLKLLDMGKPLTATFDGDMIVRRGDGDRYAYYQIRDRAGNPSHHASPVILDVSVAPISRDYEWPDIERASGSGERVTLVPEVADSGGTVIVPDFPLNPGEVIWVQWAELGQFGAYRTATPTPTGSRRYLIPRDYVAPHIDRQITVRYDVVEASSNPHPSQVRQLQIGPLDKDTLPSLSCEGVMAGILRLQDIPLGGAKLKMARWPLIATSQRVKIVVTGVDNAGDEIEHVAVTSHPVTADELTAGIGSTGNITASRDFMSRLMHNTPFSMLVYVSFDEGVTWPPEGLPNFPRYNKVSMAP
ncbi:hypothetical protein [Pseudomonas syringae]|uniref:Uncharacterized protein n=1 Tax=Pseudomonas syringae TaxID=317 RepID=A0A085V7G5_PSESX|nr:hypothetical protein [Pseudomonas syringae]KFE51378.1 hypothetical protein IV01_24320 [Pseudomonas syringae]